MLAYFCVLDHVIPLFVCVFCVYSVNCVLCFQFVLLGLTCSVQRTVRLSILQWIFKFYWIDLVHGGLFCFSGFISIAVSCALYRRDFSHPQLSKRVDFFFQVSIRFLSLVFAFCSTNGLFLIWLLSDESTNAAELSLLTAIRMIFCAKSLAYNQ